MRNKVVAYHQRARPYARWLQTRLQDQKALARSSTPKVYPSYSELLSEIGNHRTVTLSQTFDFPGNNRDANHERRKRMAAVKGIARLRALAGQAKPSPQIGQALGPLGVNMMEFCKQFNAKTETFKETALMRVKLVVRRFAVVVWQKLVP
jgi:hypothetical protein